MGCGSSKNDPYDGVSGNEGRNRGSQVALELPGGKLSNSSIDTAQMQGIINRMSARFSGLFEPSAKVKTSFVANGKNRLESFSENVDRRAANAKITFSFMSMRGFYPDDVNKPNQDAFCISSENFAGIANHSVFTVFDGHGPDGHTCAWFARDSLHKHIDRFFKQEHAKRMKQSLGGSLRDNSNPSNWPGAIIRADDYVKVATKGHVKANELMHRSSAKTQLSGTTAISCMFLNNFVLVTNVGDSRAILLTNIKGKKCDVVTLSNDQTPFRRDERDRVRKAGARVSTIEQLDNPKAKDEDDKWDKMEAGKDIDFEGDPPRIWSRYGNYPGCAFTRSLGDQLAEEVGVIAEPETLVRTLEEEDGYIVLASDGVFEFLTNEEVAAIVLKAEDPQSACYAVVESSLKLWDAHEQRVDDITVIVIKLNELVDDEEEEIGVDKNSDEGEKEEEGKEKEGEDKEKKDAAVEG